MSLVIFDDDRVQLPYETTDFATLSFQMTNTVDQVLSTFVNKTRWRRKAMALREKTEAIAIFCV
jgi:hypothetical protein